MSLVGGAGETPLHPAGELSPGPWSPLRIQVYRWLWIAGVVSNIGTFVHLTAANWTMAELTESPTLVSLVQTAWAVPGFLLALHAGALADMVDRRRFILTTQFAALSVAAALAVAQLAGGMSPTVLLAGTLLESMALTLSAPAFMALTPELVDARSLPQAIGLDAVSRNAAQTLGPALAGGLMALAGPGAAFACNAVSFLGVMAVVQRYRAPRKVAPGGALSAAIRDGVRHVAADPVLRHPVIRLALATGSGAGLLSLLPIIARDRLGVRETGFGLLSAALGLGSVCAIWLLARFRSSLRPEQAIAAAATLWSAGAALFAVADRLWVGLVALALAGAGTMGMLSVLFSNFTLRLQPWVRGRGSAVAMLMVWLGTSVGAAAWGALASAMSVRTALLAAAVLNLLAVVVGRVLLPIAPYSGGGASASTSSVSTSSASSSSASSES